MNILILIYNYTHHVKHARNSRTTWHGIVKHTNHFVASSSIFILLLPYYHNPGLLRWSFIELNYYLMSLPIRLLKRLMKSFQGGREKTPQNVFIYPNKLQRLLLTDMTPNWRKNTVYETDGVTARYYIDTCIYGWRNLKETTMKLSSPAKVYLIFNVCSGFAEYLPWEHSAP